MDAEEIRKSLLEQIASLPNEQAEPLKKKLESMNDEALMNVMQGDSEDCLFCSIASGKMEIFKIYESDNIIAILDINPASKGHVLVMPKKHFQFFSQMPNEIIFEIFLFVKSVSAVIIKVLGAQGIMITIPQGLGQGVPHLAVNLIPRYKDDNLDFNLERQKPSKEELEKIKDSIRQEIAAAITASLNAQKDKEPAKAEEQKKEEGSENKENIEIRGMRIP